MLLSFVQSHPELRLTADEKEDLVSGLLAVACNQTVIEVRSQSCRPGSGMMDATATTARATWALVSPTCDFPEIASEVNCCATGRSPNYLRARTNTMGPAVLRNGQLVAICFDGDQAWFALAVDRRAILLARFVARTAQIPVEENQSNRSIFRTFGTACPQAIRSRTVWPPNLRATSASSVVSISLLAFGEQSLPLEIYPSNAGHVAGSLPSFGGQSMKSLLSPVISQNRSRDQ